MKFFRKHYTEIIYTVVIVMAVIILATMFVMTDILSSDIDDMVDAKVYAYTRDLDGELSKKLNEFGFYSRLFATELTPLATKAQVIEYLTAVTGDAQYGSPLFLRYFDVNEFDSDGQGYAYENEEVLSLRNSDKHGHTSLLTDNLYGKEGIGFYCPIQNNPAIQGVYAFYSAETILDSLTADQNAQKSIATVIANRNGDVLKTLNKKDSFADGNVFNSIKNYVGKNADVAPFLNAIKDKFDEIKQNDKQSKSLYKSVVTKTFTDRFCGAVCSYDASFGIYTVALYSSLDIEMTAYSVVDTLNALVVGVLIIFVIFAVYSVIARQSVSRKIVESNLIDPVLGCSRLIKFEADSDEIIKNNKGTNFAVVLAKINYFSYITEIYDRKMSDKIISGISNVYKSALQEGETYGYLADGSFVFLLHYGEKETLLFRLKAIDEIVRKHTKAFINNINIKVNFSIYEVNPEKEETTRHMIDKVMVAKNSVAGERNGSQFNFYAGLFEENYSVDADAALKMEHGLENNEFEVFYQPKYNLAENKQEGCEALIRWYNSETGEYRTPRSFLSLFEENGLIVKLDKKVFRTVCEFIADCIAKKLPVYQVSVNVSRYTATQRDFIDYYISTKKRYKIPDKVLIIEFTESFAFDDYGVIGGILRRLHENGILCSIDDFGSGYSSYNILKDLLFDELKLDRFFIERGVSEERDYLIHESVVTMGKNLGLKVVQEGVETAEDVKKLRKLGCDVIQGHYYSLPLKLDEYKKFITESHVLAND